MKWLCQKSRLWKLRNDRARRSAGDDDRARGSAIAGDGAWAMARAVATKACRNERVPYARWGLRREQACAAESGEDIAVR
jgi:hypothetical protein